jgi:hypothetical protein
MRTGQRLLHEILGEVLVAGEQEGRPEQGVGTLTNEIRIGAVVGVVHYPQSDRRSEGAVSVQRTVNRRGNAHVSHLRTQPVPPVVASTGRCAYARKDARPSIDG